MCDSIRENSLGCEDSGQEEKGDFINAAVSYLRNTSKGLGNS